MAAPHVAGSVALLWSADPSLIGDVSATKTRLDRTARDTADDQCGGTPEDNNVYGEGRLDALALVQTTDPGPSGTITGTVTETSSGDPVRGVSITLDGDVRRSARTGDDGGYAATIPAGTYQASISAFGYHSTTSSITVTTDQTSVADFELDVAPAVSVSGTVVDEVTGTPVPSAFVRVPGSRFGQFTDASGAFSFTKVPSPGDYELTVDAGVCARERIRQSFVAAGSDVTVPAVRIPRTAVDAENGKGGAHAFRFGPPFGYTCSVEPSTWTPADTELDIDLSPENYWESYADVQLPFTFHYFGAPSRKIRVKAGRNGGGGFIRFWSEGTLWDSALTGEMALHPGTAQWPYADSKILVASRGTAPNRSFTIEWRNFGFRNDPDPRFSAALTLHENGDVVIAHHGVDQSSALERGYDGVELDANVLGAPNANMINRSKAACCTRHFVADEELFRYDTSQIHIHMPEHGFVSGTVRDATTGEPVAGAHVDVHTDDGWLMWRYRTGPDGEYRALLFTGRPYTVTTDARGYDNPQSGQVSVADPGEVVRFDTRLRSARLVGVPTRLMLTRGRKASFTVTNTGTDAYRFRSAISTDNPRPAGAQVGFQQWPKTVQTVGLEETGQTLWTSGVDTGMDYPWTVVKEHTRDLVATGRTIRGADLAAALDVPHTLNSVPRAMAYVPSRNLLCVAMIYYAGSNDIACADADTGEVDRVIRTGLDPAAGGIQGLAYDPSTDRFLVEIHNMITPDAGEPSPTIYSLAGPTHPDPGKRLASCDLGPVLRTANLAFHPGTGTLWLAHPTGISEVDPDTCHEVARHPVAWIDPFGIGLQDADISSDGAILVGSGPFGAPVIQSVSTGAAIPDHPSWLTVTRPSGPIASGEGAAITVTVDRRKVPSDLDRAHLTLRGNGGDRHEITIPIVLDKEPNGRPAR